MFLVWKKNGVHTSKFKPLYHTFWNTIKLSGSKLGIKFDKDSLAKEKSNYPTKMVNAYNVYDLDVWQRHPTNDFKFQIQIVCLVQLIMYMKFWQCLGML